MWQKANAYGKYSGTLKTFAGRQFSLEKERDSLYNLSDYGALSESPAIPKKLKIEVRQWQKRSLAAFIPTT